MSCFPMCIIECFWCHAFPVYDYRPRSEGDNALGSVRPSVRPSVCPSVRLSVCALTAKSIRSDYQSKVFVCVSVIRGHIRIIARMRSIGVLIHHQKPSDRIQQFIRLCPLVMHSGVQIFRPWAEFRPWAIWSRWSLSSVQIQWEIKMGGAISGTTWPTEMVHLSKFAEFPKELNGNT